MDIKSIRKLNLERLIAGSAKPKQASLADALNKKPAQISQWLSGHRTISEESAREIEARLGLPAGWMDQDGAPRVLGPVPQRITVVLHSAISSISEAVKKDMPEDVRDDVADALAKLVRRKGSEREQREVLRLLDESAKPRPHAA